MKRLGWEPLASDRAHVQDLAFHQVTRKAGTTSVATIAHHGLEGHLRGSQPINISRRKLRLGPEGELHGHLCSCTPLAVYVSSPGNLQPSIHWPTQQPTLGGLIERVHGRGDHLAVSHLAQGPPSASGPLPPGAFSYWAAWCRPE